MKNLALADPDKTVKEKKLKFVIYGLDMEPERNRNRNRNNL